MPPALRKLPARHKRKPLIAKRISRDSALEARFWQKRAQVAVAIAQMALLSREISPRAV
jgi:hypothetical protein